MIHCEYEVGDAGSFISMIDFKCDNCGVIMHCSWPMVDDKDKNYCGDCALNLGIIDGFQHAKTFMYFVGNAYFSEIINDRLHIYSEKRYKLKLKRVKNKTISKRNSPEYKIFRKSVFERDNYTCQHCKKHGTKLNAHHIKSYKSYKKLRTTISNGVTLCVRCHKKEHKRLKKLLKRK